ncbi:GNAT family N-acetyltransferase [Maribacter sp. TH_r10]|uniref:GNAT family N-acetyltransferase n=1 Tax=Maribacter sp. TH_r10 TaxID=3082086 RepID=UPI0029544927|nr:GNAT family N-acetyltransferase [Maribacter sp. TH_r10]MDV7137587.1 GNAT family N-acetyltransferase [Maribacter sp. TH_r10]
MSEVDLLGLKKDFNLQLEPYKLINYLNLSIEDSLKILEIRNHPSIRMRMANQAIISEESHIDFISKLLEKNIGYWVLKINEEILGSISMVEYNEFEASFIGGNFIAPEKIGSGFGAVINYCMHLLAFEKLKCQKIKAFVRKDNVNAIRINTLYGAVFLEESIRNDEANNDYKLIEFSSEVWFNKIKEKTSKIIRHVL